MKLQLHSQYTRKPNVGAGSAAAMCWSDDIQLIGIVHQLRQDYNFSVARSRTCRGFEREGDSPPCNDDKLFR